MISSKCIRLFIVGHGNQVLFSSLHPTVVQGLPKEPAEWRRYVGLMVLASHKFDLAADFRQFTQFQNSQMEFRKHDNAGVDFPQSRKDGFSLSSKV